MKRYLSLFLLLLTAIISVQAKEAKVYMLRINDEIGSTTWEHTRNAVKEAQETDADILLVHLNTYGGSVIHADSIRTALLHFQKPVVAFVDNNAASAGALIALACDSVFMRPDASMGAATVVNGQDGAAMPDKYQSYMRAMMRATAESHGKVMGEDSLMHWRRNPAIAEAMVDSRLSVEGLVDSTKVLTFTPDEAIKWGYAEGKATSVDEVLQQLDVKQYVIEQYKPTWETNLIGFLTNPAVQAILIMVIIGGIYFELQSPGMGFPTVAAVTAALLYFLPMFLTGIVSSWVVILFVVGLVLMLLELFVIPGFGVCGIAGIAAMAVAIFAALIQSFTVPTVGVDMTVLWKAAGTLLLGSLLAVAAIWFLTSRYGPKIVRRHTELEKSLRVADGYIGVDTSLREFIGYHAIVATDMRPAGKIMIDDKEYDAVSERGFIPHGKKVRVTRFENAQLYVVPAE